MVGFVIYYVLKLNLRLLSIFGHSVTVGNARMTKKKENKNFFVILNSVNKGLKHLFILNNTESFTGLCKLVVL